MVKSHPLRVLLAALAFPVLLATPPVSRAGTYTVLACSPTTSAGSWQPVDTFPAGLTVGNMCGGPATGPNAPQGPTDEGAMFAEDGPSITATIPNGTEAGWSFSAPAGTNIAGLTYWRSLHAYNQQSLVPGLWAEEDTTLESCQALPEGTHECNSLNNQGARSFTGLNASSLFFGVRCSLVGGDEYCGSSGGMNHFAQADMYSASVTLSEAALPTVSSVSGAGWNGGFLSGQVPLTVSASDYSGIASAEVRSTVGALVASDPQSCDYYLSVPCPNLSGGTVNVNTVAAPDGPQSLILTVRDAAGNASTQTSSQIVIDNHGPAPPTALTATLSGKEVVLSWRNPVEPPVPITTAAVTLCSATCTRASTASASGLARVPAPSPGTYTIRLSLTDAAGKISQPASVALTVPASAGGSAAKLRAIIDTRGRLYVAGPVPKSFKGPVRVCWRSKLGKRELGSRCVMLHVKHGRIAVTFHPSARARRGHITVSVTEGHRLIVRLTATATRTT